MNTELQFKLQAHLDGELSDHDAREVTSLLARDAEAAALYSELTNTCGALKGFESDIKLPESREFYWSKIEREISRLEKPAEARRSGSIFLSLRRLLGPAVGVAALLMAINLIGPGTHAGDAEIETAFADADTLTYRDYAGGTTLIWLSYPAENEFAESEAGNILN